MANTTGRGTFRKGDPRINRKGRPKDFLAFRELALSIAHEKTNLTVDGHAVTVAEAILRQWAKSGNPQIQRAFIEVAFGKVPDNIELSGPEGGNLIIRIAAPDAANND
jgi:hypothetical protein